MLVGLASTYQLAQIHGDSPLERYTRQEVNVVSNRPVALRIINFIRLMPSLRGPFLTLLKVFKENAGEGGKLSKEELKQLIEGKKA